MACAAMRIAAGEGCRDGWEQGSAWTTGGSALSGSLGSSGIFTGTFGAAGAAGAAGAVGAVGVAGAAGVAGVGVPAGDGTRVSLRSPSFSRERILDRNALL